MIAKDLTIKYNNQLQPVISFTLASRAEVEHIQTLTSLGKPLDVEVKVHRKKRSTDANSCYWATLAKLSEVLNVGRNELHLLMIQRYGYFVLMAVLTKAVDNLKLSFKLVESIGTKTQDGQELTKLKCYPSTSTYNSKQFSQLLQGVIDECKELGIPTIADEEFNRLIDEYERK